MGARELGLTEPEAFEQAALAMMAIVADLRVVNPREAVSIECEASDPERLFAQWLNGIIYEMATRKMVFSRFSVRLDGARLHGQAWGETIDPRRRHPPGGTKGATPTKLRVAFERGKWIAQTTGDGNSAA